VSSTVFSANSNVAPTARLGGCGSGGVCGGGLSVQGNHDSSSSSIFNATLLVDATQFLGNQVGRF
jgi:hypothetical protein